MTLLPRPGGGAKRGRTPSHPGTETAQVQSLTRGLSILQCLARTEGGLTLTDIAHRVQLPPSTTHRLLSTLEKTGYAIQAGDLGLWYVGIEAFTVGSSFLSNRDFVAQSHPFMRRLMEQAGETTNLAILDGTEAVFIDQVQCRETMR
ncbi:MAG: helix-turn-helix domain-containing protein, partial [Casimicrobiaceae bacterium]